MTEIHLAFNKRKILLVTINPSLKNTLQDFGPLDKLGNGFTKHYHAGIHMLSFTQSEELPGSNDKLSKMTQLESGLKYLKYHCSWSEIIFSPHQKIILIPPTMLFLLINETWHFLQKNIQNSVDLMYTFPSHQYYVNTLNIQI